ncbi:MAG: Holliday junction branch migration protein RuvA [Planctomycetaceae bacterium]
MITRITGKLTRLTESSAELEADAFVYEVYLPEFVRRRLQSRLDETVSLRTIEYLEGNPQQGRLFPRLIGFLSDAERQFFDLVCSVDGVGVKKALRAMVRPVREVATAIEEQDVKTLSTLPGIGPAVGERIVAKLRRKMARFALMVDDDLPTGVSPEHDILAEALEALLALGHTTAEARRTLDAVTESGDTFQSAEDVLHAIYRSRRPA